MIRKALKFAVLGYVGAGAVALVMERAGAYRCECDPDCWCKRPGLQVFRWVLPRWHRGPWSRAQSGFEA